MPITNTTNNNPRADNVDRRCFVRTTSEITQYMLDTRGTDSGGGGRGGGNGAFKSEMPVLHYAIAGACCWWEHDGRSQPVIPRLLDQFCHIGNIRLCKPSESIKCPNKTQVHDSCLFSFTPPLPWKTEHAAYVYTSFD